MFGGRNNRRGGSPRGGRPVCQFYLEGRCKFGDNCKNEHPAGQGGNQANQANHNRFALLNNQRGRAGAFGGSNQARHIQEEASALYLTTDGIKADLTEERPIWPLSSYGPGRNAPRQLLEGIFEQSPEEMRVLHYMAVAAGNAQETSQREASTLQGINEAIQKILSDLDGAVKYVVEGKDEHPNRIDLEKQRSAGQPAQTQTQQSQPSFGAPSASASTFGQPSTFGQKSAPQSTFGQPSAFGQPSSLGQSSSFGQPSALGNQASFGQASALGQGSSFGQPSAPGKGSSFGQPSAPGQGSSFGQPSAPGQASSFGRPSALGNAAAPGQSAFGQPSQSSVFGQASQTSGFGQAGTSNSLSPFAQNNNQRQNAFGAPSALGAAADRSSPFASAAQSGQQPQSALGAAANTPSPFGQASGNPPPQASFGSPSPFGAAAQNPSPFTQAAQGQPNGAGVASSNQQPNSSPFAQAAPQKQPSGFGQPCQPTQQSAFGQAAQPASTATATQSAGSISHLTRGPNGVLTAFKGRPVTHDREKNAYHYRNQATGNSERIWFPDGPPGPNSDVQCSDDTYTGEVGKVLETIYKSVREHGAFENGIIPEIPPKREWVGFDL